MDEQVLKDFTAKLEEFMGQVVLLHNRVQELESGVGYLLSKDPTWMAAFNAAQSQEGASDENQEIIFPES